jgi:hypothetical protein
MIKNRDGASFRFASLEFKLNSNGLTSLYPTPTPVHPSMERAKDPTGNNIAKIPRTTTKTAKRFNPSIGLKIEMKPMR